MPNTKCIRCGHYPEEYGCYWDNMPPIPYPGEDNWGAGSFGFWSSLVGKINIDCHYYNSGVELVSNSPAEFALYAEAQTSPIHGVITTACETITEQTEYIRYVAYTGLVVTHVIIGHQPGMLDFLTVRNLNWSNFPMGAQIYGPDNADVPTFNRYTPVYGDCKPAEIFTIPKYYEGSLPLWERYDGGYGGFKIKFLDGYYDSVEDLDANAPFGGDEFGFIFSWETWSLPLYKNVFLFPFNGSPLPIIPPLFPPPPLSIGRRPR